jgi:hypothetical protein
MIAFLLTPIGRYIALAVIVIMLATGTYYSIRSSAVSDYKAKELAVSVEHEDAAIKAGDRIDAIDSNPDRLRDPDPFERK